MGYVLIFLNYLLLGLNVILQSFKRRVTEAVKGARKIRGITLWDNLLYHKSHFWVLQESNNIYRIGIDDLASNIIGEADKVILPNPNDNIKKGLSSIKIISGNQKAWLPSIINGKVLSVNKTLERDPGRIARDPYGSGWLMRVQNENGGFKNLITGKEAEKWMLDEIEKLYHYLTGEAGFTYADGGEFTKRDIKKIIGEKWEIIIGEFLKT